MAESETTISKKHLRTLYRKLEQYEQHIANLESEKSKLLSSLQSGKRSERIHVPACAEGCTQKFKIGGITGYIHCSDYNNGNLGQVFLTLGKEGSLEKGLGDALARVISIGIQYGVPIKEIIKTIRDMEFFPNGPVELVDGVKGAKSIPDLLARYVDLTYIKRKNQQRKADKEEETLKEVADAAESNGIGLKICPECNKKTLKPKGMGCSDLCLSCGHVVAGGCGE